MRGRLLGIPGSELLTDVFGEWPSFHDAEVERLALETTPLLGNGPDLLAAVHTFEITDKIGADGCFVLRNHVLVSFRFQGIEEVRLEGFNKQNALMGPSIVDCSDRQLESLKYDVHFTGSFGVDARFFCCDAIVASVQPWSREARHQSGGAG